MEKVDVYLQDGMNLITQYGLKAVYALATLIIGFIVINAFVKFLRRTMTKRNVDPS